MWGARVTRIAGIPAGRSGLDPRTFQLRQPLQRTDRPENIESPPPPHLASRGRITLSLTGAPGSVRDIPGRPRKRAGTDLGVQQRKGRSAVTEPCRTRQQG